MMHRRHFLGATTILLEALSLFAPADMALAQQMQEKPQLKQSEAMLVIRQYVDKMSQAAKKRTGIEFSEEQKIELTYNILTNMKGRRIYDFVDP